MPCLPSPIAVCALFFGGGGVTHISTRPFFFSRVTDPPAECPNFPAIVSPVPPSLCLPLLAPFMLPQMIAQARSGMRSDIDVLYKELAELGDPTALFKASEVPPLHLQVISRVVYSAHKKVSGRILCWKPLAGNWGRRESDDEMSRLNGAHLQVSANRSACIGPVSEILVRNCVWIAGDLGIPLCLSFTTKRLGCQVVAKRL